MCKGNRVLPSQKQNLTIWPPNPNTEQLRVHSLPPPILPTVSIVPKGGNWVGLNLSFPLHGKIHRNPSPNSNLIEPISLLITLLSCNSHAVKVTCFIYTIHCFLVHSVTQPSTLSNFRTFCCPGLSLSVTERMRTAWRQTGHLVPVTECSEMPWFRAASLEMTCLTKPPAVVSCETGDSSVMHQLHVLTSLYPPPHGEPQHYPLILSGSAFSKKSIPFLYCSFSLRCATHVPNHSPIISSFFSQGPEKNTYWLV